MPLNTKQQSKLFLEALKPAPMRDLNQTVDKKFIKSAPLKKVRTKPEFINLKKMLIGKI